MAYLGLRTESDVMATQRQIKELVRESISRQPGEPKFFVDGRVFNSCWPRIWQWLNVQSLGAYLLKYDVVKDPTELFSLNNNYFSPRQKADALLSLVHQGGQYGYHMLYLCILEDDENPLGHADAAQMLMDYARKMRSVPPPSLLGNNLLPPQLNQQDLTIESDGPSGQGRARASSAGGQRHQLSPAARSSLPSGFRYGEREEFYADDFHYSRQEYARDSTLPPTNGEQIVQDVSPESHRWPQQRPSLPYYSAAELSSDGRVSTNPSFSYDSARTESNSLGNDGLLIPGGAYFQGGDTEMDGPISISSRRMVTVVNGTTSPPSHGGEPRSTSSEGEVAGQPLPTGQPLPARQPLPTGLSTLSKEDIMRSARDMIGRRRFNDQHLPEGCALEVLSSDEFDTKDDIIDETIKFLVSCLNGRAEGVSCGLLVAGADYQPRPPHQPKLGLSISQTDLRGLQMRFYELLRRRIFVQTVDNRIEPAHSLESLTRLEVVPVETQVGSATRTPEVVVVSVVPEMPICKDLLYLYNSSDSRRRHVYKRTADGQVKLSSHKGTLLHQQLIQHYNRWHQ